jgi:hypothetical protein
LTLAHEITHEWFYGMVATNEADEPWLDEGVTSYMTSRILEAGGDTLGQFNILGYKFNYDLFERVSAYMTRAEYPIDLKSPDYPDVNSYSTAVYNRANQVLQTLEALVGREAFDRFLKIYANEFRFKHPTAEDLIDFAVKYTGHDLTDYTNQFIHGTARLDYGIRSLEYKAIPNADSTKKYQITVTVSRELDGIMPEKLTLGLDNGRIIDTTYDGRSRIIEFKFTAAARPQYAELSNYALDENKANNTMYVSSFGSRLLSFEWDMIFLMEFILSLFL